jgi:hypothetical protein
MWRDTKVGLGDRHHWERIAVVSDHQMLNDAVRLFAWMLPAEVQTHTADQLKAATGWVCEP